MEEYVYLFKVITQEQAENIAFNWHYDYPYSFYDMEADREDLEEFLNEEIRGDSIYAVTKENELIGFFHFNMIEKGIIEIGLGMRPDLTGKGNGEEFLREGLNFISELNPVLITLSVAAFNERAIKLYEKVGFIESQTFMQKTNGSIYEFIKMEYTCPLTNY